MFNPAIHCPCECKRQSQSLMKVRKFVYFALIYIQRFKWCESCTGLNGPRAQAFYLQLLEAHLPVLSTYTLWWQKDLYQTTKYKNCIRFYTKISATKLLNVVNRIVEKKKSILVSSRMWEVKPVPLKSVML